MSGPAAAEDRPPAVEDCHPVAAGRSEPGPRPFTKAEQRGNRWRITLSDGEKKTSVDSFYARLGRCNKRVKAWAKAIPRLNRRLRRAYKARGIGPRLVMITLTYGDAETQYQKSDGWEPNHIREFMLNIRKLLKDKLWAYAWVAETQERGSVHYHVMMYVAPGTDIPKPDEAGLWPHGNTRRETAKKGPWYILKYAGKEYQKDGLPHGARMFAVWIGKAKATAEELLDYRLSSAPPYVQKAIQEYYETGMVGAEVRWARRIGGGWLIKDLGEVLQSLWYLVAVERIDIPPDIERGVNSGP